MDRQYDKLEKHLDKYDAGDSDKAGEKYFSAAINIALNEYDLQVSEIMDEFGVSKGTVSRWARGKSVPIPEVRTSVLERILRKI